MTPEEIAAMSNGRPLGRLVALQYRHVARQPGGAATFPVLRLHIRPPNPGTFHTDLANAGYALQTPALQFMALHDYQPTDIEGTYHEVEDDGVIVPIAPGPEADSWGLAQTALEGGEQALREAEWFSGENMSDGNETSQRGAGGGPDPGTGNRGGVEEPSDTAEESGVTVEQAPEESDSGVTVEVE